VKRLSLLLLLGCGQPTEPQEIHRAPNLAQSLNLTADTLSVSVIKIGKVTLQATLGTRGPGTRLMLSGVDGAGAELELVPSADHSGTGVTSQIMLFAKRGDGYARLGITVMREYDNRDDVVVIDATSSGSRGIMPMVIIAGEGKPSIRINPDGSVVTK
jgi:hypothetical protein